MDFDRKKIRVMVLEDEISMNRGIAFSLERNGFKAAQAYSLREAREILNEEEQDVYICDITLPDGSGLDFVREIRAVEKKASYVILLTALDTEADYVIGYESGADDYVSKPFSLSVLMLKLEAHVKRLNAGASGSNSEKEIAAAENRSTCICSGDIAFDSVKMEVMLAGKPVSLTKNELRLLGVFMRNPKQLLSRQQLLMQAFDVYEKYIDENTLAVNISRLREKLGDNAQNPRYIKNVRGLGYIWMEDIK